MFKKKPAIVLVFLLVLISFAYNFHEILFFRPYSIHQWRQVDGLSITLNYFQENLNFFQPSINWIGANGSGKAVGEFPFIYYTVAQLWKLFGQHEFIFKLFNIIIVFIGLIQLFRLFKTQTSDTFWSMYSVLFLFTSPVLVYYTNNFLPDAPSFGLAIIGCFYLEKYYSKSSNNALYISSLFFLIAGLLKITSLIVFVAIIPLQIFLILKNQKNRKIDTLIPFVAVFIPIIAWIKYADFYNNSNNRGVFLQDIKPIWELNFWQIKPIAIEFYNLILPNFFNITALILLLFLLIFSLFNYKNANKFLLLLTTISILGSFLFLLLFFQNLNVHDYYLVNLLIIIPLILLTFINLVKRIYPVFFKMKAIKTIAVIGLLMLIYNTAVINRMKYNTKDYLVRKTIFVDKTTLDFWKWYHWNYENTYKALENIKPFLRNVGIKRTDKVISIPDQSLNISLYLMDQKGFTDFGYAEQGAERIIKFKEMGAKYLIINDPSLLNQEYLKPFLKNQIGVYQNISIYRL